jgi:hypothetical protein
MAVNIKNEEVSRFVSELARTIDVSITDAVRIAVEERLARTRAHTTREGIAGKLMAIGAKCARQAPEQWLTWEYDADLYDERGLPR